MYLFFKILPCFICGHHVANKVKSYNNGSFLTDKPTNHGHEKMLDNLPTRL